MDKRACTGRNIMVIDKYFKLYFRRRLKAFDLNSAEGMVLLALYGSDGMTERQIFMSLHSNVPIQTQEQIIRELHYDKGALARTMKALEEKDFVQRAKNPRDSRAVDFNLTDKARELRPRIMEILVDWNDALIGGIPADDLDRTIDTLEKMAANAAVKVRED